MTDAELRKPDIVSRLAASINSCDSADCKVCAMLRDAIAEIAALKADNAALKEKVKRQAEALETFLNEIQTEAECHAPDCPECGPIRPIRATLASMKEIAK